MERNNSLPGSRADGENKRQRVSAGVLLPKETSSASHADEGPSRRPQAAVRWVDAEMFQGSPDP